MSLTHYAFNTELTWCTSVNIHHSLLDMSSEWVIIAVYWDNITKKVLK